MEGVHRLRRPGDWQQRHLPAQDHQHAVYWGTWYRLFGDLSLHWTIRLEESGRKRLVLSFLSANSPPDPAAQAVPAHHAQGLHLRTDSKVDEAMDRRRLIRKIRAIGQRNCVRREARSPDEPGQWRR